MNDDHDNASSNGREPRSLSLADRHLVADALVDEMSELFHGYLDGHVRFEELTFEMFDTVQTLFAIHQGDGSIEYLDDDGLYENITDLINRRDPPDGHD